MPDKRKKLKRFGTLMFSVIICFIFCTPFRVSCEDGTDRSIQLICRKDDVILTGMKWRIYKVGERSGSGIALTGAFAGYPIDTSNITEENVEQIAKTIASYAVVDELTPVGEGETDKNGELVFSSLSKGVYLAVGKTLQVDKTFYVPSTLLLETNDSDVVFSYDAYPKFAYITLSNTVDSYTVKKVWINDTPDSIAHPTYVTVDLYCNDKIFDTVTLNEENNWEYRWNDLAPVNDWYVVERYIPTNYTVIIDFNSNQYLIKNSYAPEYTPVTTSVTTGTATTGTATTTSASIDQTVKTNSTSTATTKTTAKTTQTSVLPPLTQTGQLWWPVIPLAAGGFILITLGVLIKSKKDDK
ncbi:Cna B-type domain-containing protein [Ruminococcus flavefaciens]|uniref:Cna B-type domain-containing protein n=1 Tax=Ruminococcus flavefaciens TaxID=1265 RepID=UPI00048A6402|nr:Cna B-type domain-containing protein [Ruminococcus flavefaciens]